MHLINWIVVLIVVGLSACGSGDPAKVFLDEEPEHLDWSLLTPENWDAMELLKGIDLSNMEDDDPRAMELLAEVREAWNHAPTVSSIHGKRASLTGYIVPLDFDIAHTREFLLVPYFGACIHTPPPPSNQIVHVHIDGQGVSMEGWDAMVEVEGILTVERNDTMMGIAGYSMSATTVHPFKDRWQPLGVD
jgi:uncharacterized protein